MNRKGKNVLLVGVGGQGTILASKVLSEGLLAFGYDVKMSEIHGMAQRGGSVSTHVRYGERVFSPVISKGEADMLVAFEKMEALRWLPFISRDGMLAGPNRAMYAALGRTSSIDIIASGGVSTKDDLRALAALGIHGAILGKALYENKITLEDALCAAGGDA